ncbi:MAG TPA: hypothetical protein VFK22_04110 [Candidatus Dormibacteraeota bacterium]|nr:hypothetical protein [Candidatus Dormibacteraeota bacterium]
MFRGGLVVELAQGLLLAVVAVLTAWSGYQAALLNTQSAISYGTAQSLRSQSQSASTLAGQQMLYDATTFSTWLLAADSGNQQLMEFIERRFRPEFKVAFDAWIATDPQHNPAAAPGPSAMPEYHNANLDKASALDRSALAAFNDGNHQRDRADEYVRTTVLLAVVLFLTALSQRFDIAFVRVAILILAIAVFGFSAYTVATIDR